MSIEVVEGFTPRKRSTPPQRQSNDIIRMLDVLRGEPGQQFELIQCENAHEANALYIRAHQYCKRHRLAGFTFNRRQSILYGRYDNNR